jgi:hypothetical protein
MTEHITKHIVTSAGRDYYHRPDQIITSYDEFSYRSNKQEKRTWSRLLTNET